MRVMLLLTILFMGGKAFCQTDSSTKKFAFLIDRLVEHAGYGTGGATVKAAVKDYKFISLYIWTTNVSKEEQALNYAEIYLLDEVNKVKYKIESVMGTGPFTSYKKERTEIKAGKNLYRKLVYVIPKNLQPNHLLYLDQLIPIRGHLMF